MKDNKKFCFKDKQDKNAILGILYEERKRIKEILIKANTDKEYWCACGMMSELNSLITIIKNL